MADFGGEDLFSVFDNIEKKKDEKTSEVIKSSDKDSIKRILLQRGEKREHDDNTDGIQDSFEAGDGEKLKRAKKTDDGR